MSYPSDISIFHFLCFMFALMLYVYVAYVFRLVSILIFTLFMICYFCSPSHSSFICSHSLSLSLFLKSVYLNFFATCTERNRQQKIKMNSHHTLRLCTAMTTTTTNRTEQKFHLIAQTK